MVQKEVQFLERVVAWGSGGVYRRIRGAPCLRSWPAAPRRRPPPCSSLAASGAKGRAAGWGRGRRGDKGRGYRAGAGGCSGELPRRCRDSASPGPGRRTPAPRGASAAMERPGAQSGPALAEPAGTPPAPPPPPPPPPPSLPAAAAATQCAANMAAAAVGRDTLPEHWSYGVCRDGRVFFIKCGAGKRGRGLGRGPGGGAGPGERPQSGGGSNRCISLSAATSSAARPGYTRAPGNPSTPAT